MSGEQLGLVTGEVGPAPASDQTSRTTDQWRRVGEFERTALLIIDQSRAKASAEAQADYLIEQFIALVQEADREAEQMADIVLDPID